jgi:fucose permease
MKPKTMGAVALMVMGFASLLCAWKVYALIVVGRFIVGVGASCSIIFFSALFVHEFERSQASLLNFFHALIAAGAVISLLTARRIGLLLGDWPAAFLAAGGAALVLSAALPMVRFPQVTLPTPSSPARLPARRFHVDSVLIACMVIFISYNIFEQGTLTFFAAFAEKERHFAVTSSVRMAALYWAGVAAGRVAGAFISRRFSEGPQIIIYVIAGAVLLMAALFAPGGAGMSAAIFCAGVAVGPVIPLAFSRAAKETPHRKAAVIALGNAASCLGGSAGPLLAGFIADAHSLFLGLAVAYGVFFASGISFLVVWKRAPKQSNRRAAN